MCPKNTEEMANSVDPGQTAPVVIFSFCFRLTYNDF